MPLLLFLLLLSLYTPLLPFQISSLSSNLVWTDTPDTLLWFPFERRSSERDLGKEIIVFQSWRQTRWGDATTWSTTFFQDFSHSLSRAPSFLSNKTSIVVFVFVLFRFRRPPVREKASLACSWNYFVPHPQQGCYLVFWVSKSDCYTYIVKIIIIFN